ncbi:MAG TPA: hypothetical protein VG387_20135 [Rhizomicrobium sp.]|nr:hypothetical protein [Rhizomicrobium sp.]
MPISFTIDHEKKFVHARTYDVVKIEHWEDYLDQIVVQGAMPYRKLYDNRDGTFIDADPMRIAARVSAYAHFDPRGPVAVIAVSDASVEVARRVLNLGNAKRPAKLFHSETAARTWLDAQPLPES